MSELVLCCLNITIILYVTKVCYNYGIFQQLSGGEQDY